MKKIREYIAEPRLTALVLLRLFAPFFTDRAYLKAKYRLTTGRDLNLDNPRRFTEKIQWLKLMNRRRLFSIYVDKVAAKDFAARIIGDKYIIPTLKVWDSPEDIDLHSLPDRFVLKTSNGGGNTGVVICKDKSNFNIKEAKARLRRSLKSSIYRNFKEWPYKGVERRILAEEYLEIPKSEDLTDYKFYCFNGEPKYCQVIVDRNTHETIDFYDMDWKKQPFSGLFPMEEEIPEAKTPQKRPSRLAEMVEIARKLAKGVPFLRVDLYEVNGHIYFGELTFFPASGLGRFVPDEWDFKLGEMIHLDSNDNII